MQRALLSLALVSLLLPGVAEAKKKKGGDGDGPIPLETGTKQLGGTAYISLMGCDGCDMQFGINVSPSGGYFVTDQVEIVGDITFSNANDTTAWGVAPGVKYWMEMDRKMAGYVQGSFGYYNVEDYNYMDIYAKGGIVYALGKNVAADLGVRFDYNKNDAYNYWNAQIGYLGVQAFFK